MCAACRTGALRSTPTPLPAAPRITMHPIHIRGTADTPRRRSLPRQNTPDTAPSRRARAIDPARPSASSLAVHDLRARPRGKPLYSHQLSRCFAPTLPTQPFASSRHQYHRQQDARGEFAHKSPVHQRRLATEPVQHRQPWMPPLQMILCWTLLGRGVGPGGTLDPHRGSARIVGSTRGAVVPRCPASRRDRPPTRHCRGVSGSDRPSPAERTPSSRPRQLRRTSSRR